MKLSVLHRTIYHYASPASESSNTLHLEPRPFPRQRTIAALVRVLPATRVRRFLDLFENATHHFEINRPHTRLEVEGRIRVETSPLHASAADLAITPVAYLEASIRERAWLFLQESRWVSLHPDLWRQSLDLTRGVEGVHAQATALMGWVHDHFEYRAGITNANTHLDEVLALRSGVCQDFAHVMIGLCRVIGIPARYVSGYLYNGPRDDLIGWQASHAWCEVYFPEAGWIGFDPTNRMLVDERYIQVAAGRDYEDVAPIRGAYVGSAHCRMEVEVLVEKLRD